jgi:acetoin utilization protein AcuB
MITVEEFATFQPVTVGADAPLQCAAAQMKLHHIHHLPVVENGAMVGMVSARDLIGLVPNPSDPSDPSDHGARRSGHPWPQHSGSRLGVGGCPLRVGDVCTTDVFVAPCETTIHRAAWLMIQNKIRSLPLVRADRVVAILTDTDLLHACLNGIPRFKGTDPTKHWRDAPVADFMHRPVITIDPESSLASAWMTMRDHDIRHLAVVRGEENVVGVISDDDVFEGLRSARSLTVDQDGGNAASRLTVADLMTRHVVMTGKYDKLSRAAGLMLENDIACLLVMDYCLEGIITRTDLLRAIVTMS